VEQTWRQFYFSRQHLKIDTFTFLDVSKNCFYLTLAMEINAEESEKNYIKEKRFCFMLSSNMHARVNKTD